MCERLVYLRVGGAAYWRRMRKRRDIGEGCGGLVTPGGDGGGSPHLRHTEMAMEMRGERHTDNGTMKKKS